jgi:L-ascorbate metabolism protein UlaG (beta-lactamase superfamily)
MKTGQALIAEIDATELAPGAISFWWMGQLSYIVKIGRTVMYLDPYLDPSPRRNVPPLLRPEEITHADWVFGSHDHSDHIDPYAIRGIAAASPQARFVCSRVAQAHFLELGVPAERIVALDEGMAHVEGDLSITPVAAAHEWLDRDPQRGHPYLGFVVSHGGATIYHAGDTCVYDGMLAKLLPWMLDLAMVPINGRDAERLARGCIGNMTYQEAVDLVGALAPRLAVPGHYDMFNGNMADPQLFADYMDVKYPKAPYWIGGHGERVILAPRPKPMG